MAYEIAGADERVSLADLIRWMNKQGGAQRERPSGKAFRWYHRAARKQLEILGLRFRQEHGPRGKLTFSLNELRECCKTLADAFRPPKGSQLPTAAEDR